MNEHVQLQMDGPVARLVLARMDKLNALTLPMLEALDAACDRLERSRDVRAVILSSANAKAFCSGADIAEWGSLSAQDMWGVWTRVGHRIFDRLAALPQPTIAAVHGAALGGGLELALGCDLRIAASDSVFAMPEVRVGAIPGWGGTSRLARLVGPGRAKHMILRAAQIDAATALNWGLVEEVVAPDALGAHVFEVASEIAARAPGAVRLAKQLINGGSSGGVSPETLAAGLALSLEDGREGVAAFKEKRAPRFTGA
jgi:enoyl-CoA hydratase/carnithine racemase